MKRRFHKGLISAVVATAFASLWAAPVTCDQARTAVGNWLRADPSLGCRLGQSVDSARTCTTTNGANFHVVRLAGGGFVVTSADVPLGKPNPDMLLYISEKENLPTSHMVMIGDSYVDVAMAKAAGSIGFGVTVFDDMKEKMKPYATEILDSLEGIEINKL